MLFPRIENVNYYFIKTNNGKFYNEYTVNEYVGLFNINLNETVVKKQKQLEQFTAEIQENDIVLIPNYKNRMVTIGRITSSYYYKNSKIYRNVKWEKEIPYESFEHKFDKYVHCDNTLVPITYLANLINRLLYSVFLKDNKYHLILNVEQQKDIMCKSLYGLYEIIFDATKVNDLQIKLKLESPGMIEFITESLDFILIMIKIIKIIQLLKKDKSVLTKLQIKELKQNEKLIETYYQYEVDKLLLELNDFKQKK